MDRGRAAIGLDSHGHAATGRNSSKTLVRDDRRSQDFTLGTLSPRNANTHNGMLISAQPQVAGYMMCRVKAPCDCECVNLGVHVDM